MTNRVMTPTSEQATAGQAAEPGDGVVRVWDNANIVESYPGLTTPLTYSIAREAYASVYRQLCRTVGVSERVIAEQTEVFEQMIGLLQGRVYYNLTSWHRVLALLPGLRYSQAYMERMMGAARPGGTASPPSAPAPRHHLAETGRIALRLLWLLFRFEGIAHQFERSIAALRADYAALDLAGRSPDALLGLFDAARRRSLDSWRAPILNDLFVMVFHGALRRAADAWLGDGADTLVNTLLRAGDLPSAAPARALWAIAARLETEPAWAAALETTPPAGLAHRLEDDPALAGLRRLINDYLTAWGDRCPEELKLDRPTYRDDPAPLFLMLREMRVPATPAWSATATIHQAEAECARRLSRAGRLRGWWRRWLFAVLLDRTRYHVRWREQLRFARSQVFGIGRRLFAALGRTLARQGLLESADDIHYLHIDELRAALRGTAEVGRLDELSRRRRAAYAAYAAAPALPSRLETIGPVALGQWRAAPAALAGQRLHGTGACAGRVEAPCVVVTEPHAAGPVAGRIIVAQATDPGWVPLMAVAAGLAVERGGLLSHSAIVARELGLPTVVGVAGLLATVHSGQRLALDGASGEIQVLAAEGEPR